LDIMNANYKLKWLMSSTTIMKMLLEMKYQIYPFKLKTQINS